MSWIRKRFERQWQQPGKKEPQRIAILRMPLGPICSEPKSLPRSFVSEAQQTYQEAIDAAPESIIAHYSYGLFSQGLNWFEIALTAYKSALDIARRPSNTHDVAATLNNLGILHRAQNRMEEARLAVDEALSIRRELAGTNPDAYLPYVADTLSYLGILLAAQGQFGDALVLAQEALTIYEKCATKTPLVCAPKVGGTRVLMHMLRMRMARERSI